MGAGFGSALKEWRNRRRLSQLDLGLAANVSARHISFLETGRSRPSRMMVQHLCEELAVPLEARNMLYRAAGFASAYQSKPFNDNAMAPVREAMEWTLERHNPYPAFALDRHWAIVAANHSAAFMLQQAGIGIGGSLLAIFADKDALISTFENWEEVARHIQMRLRTESAYLGGDNVLDEVVHVLDQMQEPMSVACETEMTAVIPARYRAGDQTLSFFSTIAQFGTAQDIALSELRIELLFPSDEKTRTLLHAMADGT